MQLGLKVKKIRMQCKLTQQEVADSCGFTKSLLSKIENGSVMPPIATLTKLSKALGIRMSTLLEDGENDVSAYYSSATGKTTDFVLTSKGYSILPLVPDHVQKKMTPLLVRARQAEVKKHLVNHEGEELIHILKGDMYFKVSNIEYFLHAGESIYFSSLEPHGIIKVDNEVLYLDILVE